jgi:hypothetical protein
MRPFSKPIALICLLLTFWSAGALIAHHHSSANDAAKCSVCVAAHSTAPKTTTSTLPDTAFVIREAFRAQPVATKQRLVAFALSVRPPPTV